MCSSIANHAAYIFARMSVYNNRSQCNAVGLCKLRHTRTISDGYILLRRVVTQGHPLSGKTYTLGSGVMEEQGGNANPESEGKMTTYSFILDFQSNQLGYTCRSYPTSH